MFVFRRGYASRGGIASQASHPPESRRLSAHQAAKPRDGLHGLVGLSAEHALLRAEQGAVRDQLSRRESRLAAEHLRNEGAEVDPRVEEYEYGRFAWIMDPEGNRVELWEPPRPAK